MGCGKRYLKGYLHVECSRYEHIDYVKPIHPLPSIKDGTIEEIYFSHALEYYDFEEAKIVYLNGKGAYVIKARLDYLFQI